MSLNPGRAVPAGALLLNMLFTRVRAYSRFLAAASAGVLAAGVLPLTAVAAAGPAFAADPVLPAPTGLTVTKTGNNEVWLDWDDVPGAQRYVVFYNPADDPSAERRVYTIAADAPPSERSVRGREALPNGVEFEFEVAAQNNIPNPTMGPKSAPVYATPVSPPIPADFRVTSTGNESVYFNWSDVADVPGYYIRTRLVDAGSAADPKVPGLRYVRADQPEQARFVSGLTNGATYAFAVASREGWAGDFSDELIASPALVPGSPGVVKQSVSADQITVELRPRTDPADVPAADRYRVLVQPAIGEDFVVETTTTTASFDAVEGVTYSITAQAGNSNGYGPKDFTPLVVVAADRPGAVLFPTSTRTGDGSSVLVMWDPPNDQTGILRYHVNPSPVNPDDPDPVSQTVEEGTMATFTGLNPSGDYVFAVLAVTDAGVGSTARTGSLADAPTAGAVRLDDDGTVVMDFVPSVDSDVTYQAQATNVADTDGGVNIAASAVECSNDVCTATWERFDDNIGADEWFFQVRAVRDLVSSSNYSTGFPVEPPNPAQVASVESLLTVSCPEGKLNAGNECVLPDGSVSNVPAQLVTDHVVDAGIDWDARTDKGVWSASVNGADYTGEPVQVGSCPGSVDVTFTGLTGSVTSSVSVPCVAVQEFPGPVTDAAAEVSGGSTAVSWTAPQAGDNTLPATEYSLEWSSGSQTYTQTVTGTSASITNAPAGTSVRITPVSEYGPGVGSTLTVQGPARSVPGTALTEALGRISPKPVFEENGWVREYLLDNGHLASATWSDSTPYLVILQNMSARLSKYTYAYTDRGGAQYIAEARDRTSGAGWTNSTDLLSKNQQYAYSILSGTEANNGRELLPSWSGWLLAKMDGDAITGEQVTLYEEKGIIFSPAVGPVVSAASSVNGTDTDVLWVAPKEGPSKVTSYQVSWANGGKDYSQVATDTRISVSNAPVGTVISITPITAQGSGVSTAVTVTEAREPLAVTYRVSDPNTAAGMFFGRGSYPSTKNIVADCGAEGVVPAVGETTISCNYPQAGDYTITVTGTFNGSWRSQHALDSAEPVAVLSFGELGTLQLGGAFRGIQTNPTMPASLPDGTTTLSSMFADAKNFNQDLSTWDVSNVTAMDLMFMNAYSFNGNITTWDTSNVVSLRSMFNGALAFNQDISRWDTSQVTNMNSTFRMSWVFNQDLGGWDVSNVTDHENFDQEARAWTLPKPSFPQ